MTIYLKKKNEELLELSVNADDTIFELKMRIQEVEGTVPAKQILTHKDIVLDDRNTIDDYAIKTESIIMMDTEKGKSSGLII